MGAECILKNVAREVAAGVSRVRWREEDEWRAGGRPGESGVYTVGISSDSTKVTVSKAGSPLARGRCAGGRPRRSLDRET